MAFQATYYSLYGRAAPTYEPAMTKAFLRGRTETIRTVQPHTLSFVETWVSPKATVQEKLQALRSACSGHTKISKEAASGRGFDRYVSKLTTGTYIHCLRFGKSSMGLKAKQCPSSLLTMGTKR